MFGEQGVWQRTWNNWLNRLNATVGAGNVWCSAARVRVCVWKRMSEMRKEPAVNRRQCRRGVWGKMKVQPIRTVGEGGALNGVVVTTCVCVVWVRSAAHNKPTTNVRNRNKPVVMAEPVTAQGKV